MWVSNYVGRTPQKKQYKSGKKIDDWEYIKKYRKSKKSNINDKIYDKEILKEYIRIAHKDFTDEGIDIRTQNFFDIHYDWKTHRIVIPIYNIDGELLGVKGRLIKQLEAHKDDRYIALYSYSKSNVLYGLHRTYPDILSNKKMILFESEKSVMKAFSMGHKNCVSISGQFPSENQLKQIVKYCSGEIILALDNDVEKDLYERAWTRLRAYGRVSVVSDKIGILSEKDSPVDKGKEVFEELLAKRIPLKEA